MTPGQQVVAHLPKRAGATRTVASHPKRDPGARRAVRHVRRDARGKVLRLEPLAADLPKWPGVLIEPEQLQRAQRLLVRRDAGLGDCLMILPALRSLAREHPYLGTQMYVPPEYTKLLASFSVVDEALPLNAWPESAPPGSATADLSWYVERHPSATHVDRITLFAGALGTEPLMDGCDWRSPPGLRADAQAWIAANIARSDGPLVGICLRGAYPHRSWVEEHAFELARRLVDSGRRVIVFDAQRDAEHGGQLPWRRGGAVGYAYGLKLPLVAELLASCEVMVTPDTGLLHLAAAMGTRFVAIFGAIEPSLRLMHYKKYRCLSAAGEVPCVPCSEDQRHRSCSLECLRAVTPARVHEAVGELLGT